MKAKQQKILFSCLLIAMIAGCAHTPSANLHEIIIAGKSIKYVSQKCSPSIKWDGFDVSIEGLDFPGSSTNPLQFKVGKIDFEEKSTRMIKSTIFYYDGLLVSTCQTLVRLKKEESILTYSNHRDEILQKLTTYLADIENAKTDEEVSKISIESKTNIEISNSNLTKK